MTDFFESLLDEKTALSWIDQRSPEWDRIRVGRFTSSQNWRLIVQPKDKSKKVSETTMTYIMEKVAEVMTGQAKQQGYAFPIVHGIETEPLAKEFFQEKTGIEIEECGFFPYTEHAGGSPDGLISTDQIIEIKCPYDSKVMIDYLMLTDYHDLKRDFREYYWQIQNNLLFTERKLGHFIAFDPRMQKDEHKMKVIEVPAVDKDHQMIIDALGICIEEKLKILNLLK
jgi:hypothetical protein